MVCWYYFEVQGVLFTKTSLLFTKTLVDTLADHTGCNIISAAYTQSFQLNHQSILQPFEIELSY